MSDPTKNPLRRIFWDTFTTTREEDSAGVSALRTAINSLVPTAMKWVGDWQIVALSPSHDGERRAGGGTFVVDAEGRLRGRVQFSLDIRDVHGRFPSLEVLTYEVDFLLSKEEADWMLAAAFDPETRVVASDYEGQRQLGQAVFEHLAERVRETAVQKAGVGR